MGVTPMQMARAYATFANGGYLVEPNISKEVKQHGGRDDLQSHTTRWSARTVRRRPQSPIDKRRPARDADGSRRIRRANSRAARHRRRQRFHHELDAAGRDPTRHRNSRAKALNRNDLAGKTGTTNEADTWFNGYQKNLVASVWVGFSDHRPVGDNEYGSNSPLPIWMDFMKVALDGVPEETRQQPPDVVTLKIDPRTGEPASPDQQNAMFEYFLADHAPTASRIEHRRPTTPIRNSRCSRSTSSERELPVADY